MEIDLAIARSHAARVFAKEVGKMLTAINLKQKLFVTIKLYTIFKHIFEFVHSLAFVGNKTTNLLRYLMLLKVCKKC